MIRSIHIRVLLPLLCACVLVLGCSRRREVVQYDYVEPAHVCTAGCHDHYYVDQNVIYVTGHRHSVHCGHYWDGHCWRMNRDARLNPRPYSSGRIHPNDRHGHYNRPKPNRRDRYENRDRYQDRNDRRVNNSRRDNDNRRDQNGNRRGNERYRQSDRDRNNNGNRTRPEKVNQTTRQKRSGDDDNSSMGRRRSSD